MSKFITKTNFVNGCQCPKYLWLSIHQPQVCDTTDTAHTEEGHEVGELARTYFSDSITVPLRKAAEMAEETKRLLDAGYKTICEATFTDGEFSCSADIVRVLKDGALDVIEVKSSTNIKDIQVYDVAFQRRCIERAGYRIHAVYLMILNKEYVRHDDLDIHQLFVLHDITHLVSCITEREVEDRILALQTVANADEEPYAEIAYHCDSPHECPCKSYCFECAGIPKESIFSVARLATKKKYDYYRAGIVTAEDIKEYAVKHPSELSAKQLLQVSGMGSTEYKINVNKEKTQEFLDTVQYPLYLLDFETYQKAIPQWEGTKPYQQVPFQYSLHIMTDPFAALQHREYLAEVGKDPRRALAEQLCRDIPDDAMTMAYNMSFERTVLLNLSEIYPDLSEHLLAIRENMIDLMNPFRSGCVYEQSMRGSYSIKAVLPALCGGDPSLDYHALPVVHNGAEAMATFAALDSVEDENEIQRIREGLLLYCGLDTLAMVKVLQKLYKLTE